MKRRADISDEFTFDHSLPTVSHVSSRPNPGPLISLTPRLNGVCRSRFAQPNRFSGFLNQSAMHSKRFRINLVRQTRHHQRVLPNWGLTK